jgi:thioredoxin 1
MLGTVTDESFAEQVLASERPVAVDFWAPWCAPCKVMSRNLTELAGEFGDQIALVEINADDNPITTRTYRVMAMPTLLVFSHGEVVASVVGARPKTQLRQVLSGIAA